MVTRMAKTKGARQVARLRASVNCGPNAPKRDRAPISSEWQLFLCPKNMNGSVARDILLLKLLQKRLGLSPAEMVKRCRDLRLARSRRTDGGGYVARDGKGYGAGQLF